MSNIIFEDKISIIDRIIEKHRPVWTLKAVAWMDYDDIAQDLRLHIYEKWHLWDQTRPIEPWLNTVVHNRIVNILRDHYSNFKKPCVECKFKDGEESCLFTPSKIQCAECPLYAKWEKSKKGAYDVKLPVSIVHHEQEIENMPCEHIDLQKYYLLINTKIDKYLTKTEVKIYRMLYIDSMTEDDVARELGLTSNEKNRKAGYRQIITYRKRIIEKIKKMLYKEDLGWN